MAKPQPIYTVRLLADAPGPGDSIHPAGTEIEGSTAYRLVQMGLAEPVCDLAKTRAEIDATRGAAARLADERERKNRRANERQRLDARKANERAAFERLLHGDDRPHVAEAVTDIEPATGKARKGKKFDTL